jgi:hypothetical protein
MTTTIQEIRAGLLELHKALLEYQKHIYQSTIGPVQNPNHYYQLVVQDPSFNWLKSLSALVVSIDELLESEEGITDAKQTQIAKYTKDMLTAFGGKSGFEENYTTAIQKDGNIAVLHGNLIKLLSN